MWADRIVCEAEDGWGFILRDRENEIGYQSITTPRTLAALDYALKQYGTMALADLIQPAIDYAETGCLIRPHVAEFWNKPPTAGRDGNIGIVTKFPAARKIYTDAAGATPGGWGNPAQFGPGRNLSPDRPVWCGGFLPRRDRPPDRCRHAGQWRADRRGRPGKLCP